MAISSARARPSAPPSQAASGAMDRSSMTRAAIPAASGSPAARAIIKGGRISLAGSSSEAASPSPNRSRGWARTESTGTAAISAASNSPALEPK